MYFLGEASNYRGRTLRHFFAIGSKTHSDSLKSHLSTRYHAEKSNIFLMHSGRSALCLALKTLVPKGSAVLVNGFTCHAVVEAVKSAHLTPVFADIEPTTLNFSTNTLKKAQKSHQNIKAIILQNTFGNPLDIAEIEKFAKKNSLIIIEDMAHCVGRFYRDGREIGTVGHAAAFSFGKGKSIDTITGGALILRTPNISINFPELHPRLSDTLRARWYPVFGVFLRASFHLHLNKFLAGALIHLHFIERSADTRLDLTHRLSHWQARLALDQFTSLNTKSPLRDFTLVEDRDKLLEKLKKNGYNFDEFWYETPVSPRRYYQKSGFIESDCPVATSVSKTIINLPTWYQKSELKLAQKIIKEHKNGR